MLRFFTAPPGQSHFSLPKRLISTGLIIRKIKNNFIQRSFGCHFFLISNTEIFHNAIKIQFIKLLSGRNKKLSEVN